MTMKRNIIYILRRALLLLCMMTGVSMAWAVEVATENDLITALADQTQLEITLKSDIALTSTLTITSNVTLDLNGHSITSDGVRAIHITSGDNVVITSATPATISASGAVGATSSVIRIGDNSGDPRNVKLTLGENIIVSSDKCYGVTVFGSKTTETLIVNGQISTTAMPAIGGNGSTGFGNTTIEIGETAQIATTNELAIYQPQNGSLTVKGSVTGLGGIELKAGSLTVASGAHIEATGTPYHNPSSEGSSTLGYAIAIVENGGGYEGVGNVSISPGATIIGPIAELKDSDNPKQNVTYDEDGLQMTVEIVGGNKYVNFADALSACDATASLRLLKDIEMTKTSVIEKNITLDLNGQDITVKNNRAFWIKSGSLNVTTSDATPDTIRVVGSMDPTNSVIHLGDDAGDSRTVTLNIGAGVTVLTELCHGITAYGSATQETLTVAGSVLTKDYPAISGDKNDKTNGAFVSVTEGAKVSTDNNVAIYHPQISALSVDGTITGAGGIEIKAGSLSVGEHASIEATGTPTHTPNNDGPSSCGYSIAVVENENNGKVTTVTIENSATIVKGPVAELYDSQIADFAPSYSGAVSIKVAAIGNDEYFKLTDAIAIVPTNGTVKLLDDITSSSPINLDRVITSTLDLNGHILTGNGCTAVAVTNGHVTITSSAESPKGTITSSGSDAVIQFGSDTGDKRTTSLTIGEKVDINATDCSGIAVAGSKTRETLTVYGDVTSSGKPAIIGSGDAEKGGTTITIAATSTVTTSNNVAIYHPQSGDLVIDGKVIGSGTTGGAIEMKGGDLTVNAGATVTATGTSTHTASDNAPSTNGYAIAIVENEHFSGVGKVFIDKDATVTGVIASLIDSKNNNVAEPEFNGDVYMLAEVMMTETYGEKYAKLADAVTAAEAVTTSENVKTVRILDYVTLTETLNITKNITLNLDVYDITGNQTSGAAIAVSSDATIKNGGITTAQQGIAITGGKVTLQQLEVNADAGSLIVSGASTEVTTDNRSVFTSSTDNTFTISAGNLTINGKVTNSGSNAAIAGTGTAATTVNTGATITSATGKGIDWESTGTLTIEGGKVTGAGAVYANKGSVAIKGGTFKGTGTGENSGCALYIDGSNCTPSVMHGSFYHAGDSAPIVATDATGFVEGDYFNNKIAQILCATGFRISTTENNNRMFYLVSELVITDATIWEAPLAPETEEDKYTIHTARYIRNSGMGTTKYGTLCLPFAFSATQPNMTFYAIHNIDKEWLYLNAIDTDATIAAGKPVVFARTGDLSTSFSIESTDAQISPIVAGEENGLVGTFKKTTIKTDLDKIYYLNGDHFHQADTELTVPAFRAYIYGPDIVSAARVLNISTDDDDTEDIDAVLMENEIEAVFDMQGLKREGLQKGMNIMKMSNGRTIKVYVNE